MIQKIKKKKKEYPVRMCPKPNIMFRKEILQSPKAGIDNIGPGGPLSCRV